jgi:hypothetical protein
MDGGGGTEAQRAESSRTAGRIVPGGGLGSCAVIELFSNSVCQTGNTKSLVHVLSLGPAWLDLGGIHEEVPGWRGVRGTPRE